MAQRSSLVWIRVDNASLLTYQEAKCHNFVFKIILVHIGLLDTFLGYCKSFEPVQQISIPSSSPVPLTVLGLKAASLHPSTAQTGFSHRPQMASPLCVHFTDSLMSHHVSLQKQLNVTHVAEIIVT